MKVIGLTGTIGSGKNLIKNILMEKLDAGCITLSDVIKREAKNEGLDRKNLQDVGNELRKRHGKHILVELALKNLPEKKDIILIDGIRNPGEIDYLRKKFNGNFKLIAVDAERKIRFERLLKRKKEGDPRSWEEFLSLDERDQGKEEPDYGQRTRECINQADFLILNNGSKEELKSQIEKISSRLF